MRGNHPKRSSSCETVGLVLLHGPCRDERGLSVTRTIDVDRLQDQVGTLLGTTEWYNITQEQVDAFAEATGDFAAIHVDKDSASHAPLGDTIADGLYILSLGPRFIYEIIKVSGFSWDCLTGTTGFDSCLPYHPGSACACQHV